MVYFDKNTERKTHVWLKCLYTQRQQNAIFGRILLQTES